jgi:hypothetical protein
MFQQLLKRKVGAQDLRFRHAECVIHSQVFLRVFIDLAVLTEGSTLC